MAEHHSKEGEVFLLRGMERAGEAFAHPDREAGVAQFRLLHDPHRRRTGPEGVLSNLADAQPKHFVAEAFAMSATLPFRELPDVRHLMEQNGDERTRVGARADVQREGDPAVNLPVDGRCLRIGVAGHVRWPSAAVQDHRHGRKRPTPAVMVAEAVKPVELAIDVLEHRIERRGRRDALVLDDRVRHATRRHADCIEPVPERNRMIRLSGILPIQSGIGEFE